jgi:hypothetical protein
VGWVQSVFSEKNAVFILILGKLQKIFLKVVLERILNFFSITARQIWLRRNEWIHDETFSHPNELILGVHQKLDDFHIINKKEEGGAILREVSRWKVPESGWMKVNCDETRKDIV